jgi:type II secretory pathway pseudopilin PulG
MIKREAFTLIEIVVVMAILIIVILLSVVALRLLTRETELEASVSSIVSTLNIAKNKALASEKASQYGIYFDTLTIPNKYILFQGSNYASRNAVFDVIHNLPSSIEISSVSLGGGSEVIFNRLEGDTDTFGLITVHSSLSDENKVIYIYSSGEISDEPESVSGSGRISDSRHVHFDLGWSIVGANTLKFDFINASQIEQIPMVDNFSSTSFDWEGEFLVDGVPQKFRIHTHQLDPITFLCIHRDRNNKNTEEVYIYISQGGIEKEIAHYDDDENSTVTKGIYVWNAMEKQ